MQLRRAPVLVPAHSYSLSLRRDLKAKDVGYNVLTLAKQESGPYRICLVHARTLNSSMRMELRAAVSVWMSSIAMLLIRNKGREKASRRE